MVQMVIFINLFFVPALPLYMIYRKNQKSLNVNLDLLFQYCIVAACNIPLTKVFIFLAKKIRGIFISIDSGYYTLAALASSILVYLLCIYAKSELRKKHWDMFCTLYNRCGAVLHWLYIRLFSGSKKLCTMLCKLFNRLSLLCAKHYTYYKSYLTKKFWTEKIKQRGLKRIMSELAPAYILIFASCFMMLIFEPILLYATSAL